MANWFKNVFGGSGEQKQSPSCEPEVRKPEFRPVKLPPRRDEAPKMVDEAFELNWFELQISPHEFRFAVASGRDALIAFKRDKASNCETHLLPIKDNKSNIDLAFSSLHAFLQKHNVRGTSFHKPEKTMQAATLSIPSLHLRFQYGNRGWASFYLIEEIPPNIQALFDDCYKLAISIIARSPKRQLSNEEVLKDIKVKLGQ